MEAKSCLSTVSHESFKLHTGILHNIDCHVYLIEMAQKEKRERTKLVLWREKGTPLGELIEYLDFSDALGKSRLDVAMDTLSAHWLPLMLKKKGIEGEELKSAGRKAIAQLMQQIEIIRLECGLRPDEMPFAEWMRLSPPVVPTPPAPPPVPTAPVPSPVQTATAPVPPPTVVENTEDGDEEDDGDDGDGFDSFGDKLEDGWMV